MRPLVRKRLILFCLCVPAACQAVAADDPAAFVDPFIGTAGTGHATPAACVPFGLVQAGPDTGCVGWRYCSGYSYGDRRILGFSQTHLNGTGWMDLGDIRLMPVPVLTPDEEAAFFSGAFSKSSERAACGFYSVRLEEPAALVEVTATDRVAFYRMTFDDPARAAVVVDFQHGLVDSERTARDYVKQADVRVAGGTSLVGWRTTECWVRRTCGFEVAFSRPFRGCTELPRREGERAPRFRLTFDALPGGELLIKVGLSATSASAARENLRREVPAWNFDEVRQAAHARWTALLSRAEAGGTEAQRRTWYTSLYRLCFQPNVISDAGDEPYYSTFSCWDTFRAAHPLYTLICPELAGAFVKSMLRQGRATGFLPIWTLWGVENQGMIGTHSVPVIVDWYLKTRDPEIDWTDAYRQIKDTLTGFHPGRSKEQWDVYDRYGYYAFDRLKGSCAGSVIRGESVSRTLECAYDDACAARMAAALGNEEDAEFFGRRSGSWRNVFDSDSGFVRGRDSKGAWREPFDPHAFGHGSETASDFTEGNAFQYTWHVLHDADGLMSALGGRQGTIDRLDGLFSTRDAGGRRPPDITGLIGQYVHGNEPSHHVIYYYTLAGRADRAADRIREVCDRFYLPKPDGLCGNDDCGQMSAWYLFSAMGFYPFDPCGGCYVIGAPQVPSVTLRLRGGRVFRMTARGISKSNRFVRSVRLNGRPLRSCFVRHEEMVSGGTLEFSMTGDPVSWLEQDAVSPAR